MKKTSFVCLALVLALLAAALTGCTAGTPYTPDSAGIPGAAHPTESRATEISRPTAVGVLPETDPTGTEQPDLSAVTGDGTGEATADVDDADPSAPFAALSTTAGGKASSGGSTTAGKAAGKTTAAGTSKTSAKTSRTTAATTTRKTTLPTAAHVHQYTDKITKEPTCTQTGVRTFTCSCGSAYTETLQPVHDFQKKVIEPTDFESGYTTRVCTKCGADDGSAEDVKSPNLTYQEQILKLVNEARAENGLPPLEYRYDLQEAADIRRKELDVIYSHTRPDGTDCYTVLSELGHDLPLAFGENIASGFRNSKSVMQAWMDSPGHRANILGAGYTGFVVSAGGYYKWVQMFVG